ncbi:endonuclease/exonuclease/phosphatase [Desulfovibrio sp. A2]|nr:endonuclease/exonuclease/phosphatase [Desulfovibrio sp. A2]
MKDDGGSDLKLSFVVNHLHRGNATRRVEQARLLKEWVSSQPKDVNIIAVGDYNFDWDLPDGASRDKGFDVLVASDGVRWVKPEKLIKTQCSPRYNSVLDFVFLGQHAKMWDGRAQIYFPDPNYCTSSSVYSDHRPVGAVLDAR